MYSKLTKFSGLYSSRISRLVHFLFIVVLMVLTSTSYAQVKQNYARVDLKSGTTVEGKVIKIDYQKSIDLFVNQQDTLHIPWGDILNVSFIDAEIKERARALVKPQKVNKPFRDSGTYFFFDAGIPLGLDYWGDPVAGGSVNFGYGKGFNYRHHLAATIGYDAYLWPDVTIVPLGLEYYGRFKEQNKSWFYFYGTGFGLPHLSEYSWRDNSKVTGGLYFNPGFGITNKRHEKRSWYLKFGYKYQTLKAEYQGFVWEFGSSRVAQIKEEIFYHRIDIRFGLRFD